MSTTKRRSRLLCGLNNSTVFNIRVVCALFNHEGQRIDWQLIQKNVVSKIHTPADGGSISGRDIPGTHIIPPDNRCCPPISIFYLIPFFTQLPSPAQPIQAIGLVAEVSS